MGTPASPLALLTHCPPLSSRTLHVPLFIPTAVLCCGLQLCTNDAVPAPLGSPALIWLVTFGQVRWVWLCWSWALWASFSKFAQESVIGQFCFVFSPWTYLLELWYFCVFIKWGIAALCLPRLRCLLHQPFIDQTTTKTLLNLRLCSSNSSVVNV